MPRLLRVSCTLLKQDTRFVWDETAQLAFEALKKYLLSAPLLHPPDYSRDFILYLAMSESIIGVVLVQEDDRLQEPRNGLYLKKYYD